MHQNHRHCPDHHKILNRAVKIQPQCVLTPVKQTNNKYLYIFLLLIFCSFFLWKVLIATAQYLLTGAELDYDPLAEIKWI
jgi:hypothetical protein